MLGHMFLPVKGGRLGMDNFSKLMAGLSLLLMFMYDYISSKTDIIALVSRKKLLFRYIVYFALVTTIALLKAAEHVEFVYFQF